MRESIKKIIQLGASVSLPYKSEISSHFGDVKIYKLDDEYIIHPHYTRFYNIDDAVGFFCNLAFTSKNFGYTQIRLFDKGLLNDSDEHSIENPDRKIKALFKTEGKLIDEEFKLMNIYVKPFPTKKEAYDELKILIESYTDIESLKNLVINFKRKYSMLGVYINISAKYDSGGEHNHRLTFEMYNINEEIISKYKDTSRFTNPTKFIGFELCVDIDDDKKYKRFDLNI